MLVREHQDQGQVVLEIILNLLDQMFQRNRKLIKLVVLEFQVQVLKDVLEDQEA